ncbi:MAG: glycogen/starch synthase [Ignavibacteriae bacterium]|nr:glycogen/starch synthase [Ignavibacteriota bacterium]
MVASENDALRGGKVGGIGDVIRNLPVSLEKYGWRVTVLTPSYGYLHNNNPSTLHSMINFPFAGKIEQAELWKVTPKVPYEHIRHLVVEHPAIRGNPIYVNDPPESPFMHDATKYALFCSAVGQFLLKEPSPFVLHLHDWHTATILMLMELHPRFSHLKSLHTVFTIHNLAIQGTRPMRGHASSVQSWFPELFEDSAWISHWKDPRYQEPLYTPMAVGIQYAHKVNAVSPNYTEEILQPSDHQQGWYRGEGLESFLQQAKNERRLFGILNGCEYPNQYTSAYMSIMDLSELIQSELIRWRERNQDSFIDELIRRIDTVKHLQHPLMLTSITRVVEQKVGLFFEKGSNGKTALDQILNMLAGLEGLYFFLGSGTPDYEKLLRETSRKHKHLIFISEYSEAIANALYAKGTLFLMPSLYEPCGISQMLAMRDGQPCVVHSVGGLKDTVIDNVNGFTFSGNSFQQVVDDFVQVTQKAIRIFLEDKCTWENIRMAAKKSRFTWESSARKYIDLLYT